MEKNDEVEYPPVFSHSVKIDQTAKGARVTVHVHANSQETAIGQAVETYKNTIKKLEENGQPVAPIEEGKSK